MRNKIVDRIRMNYSFYTDFCISYFLGGKLACIAFTVFFCYRLTVFEHEQMDAKSDEN